MFSTFDDARRYMEENSVEMIDLKFTDLLGRWHHLTIPVGHDDKVGQGW